MIIGFKTVSREIRRLLHPRAYGTVRFERRQLDEQTVNGVSSYILVYLICFGATFLLLSFDKYGFVENFSAAAACLNNIGPGFGAVGPASNYSGYSFFSKIILSFAMLAGRLELYPILLTLMPPVKAKKI